MRLLICFLLALGSAAMGADPADYLRLAEGDYWKLEGSIAAPKQKAKVITIHRKIEGKKEHQGKTYLQAQEWTGNAAAPTKTIRLLRKAEDGIWSLETQEPEAREQLETASPLAIGKKWTNVMSKQTFHHEAVAVEDVTVYEQKYAECFKIRAVSADESIVMDYWEAPRVGCVKIEMTYKNGVKMTVGLREFKPGAGTP